MLLPRSMLLTHIFRNVENRLDVTQTCTSPLKAFCARVSISITTTGILAMSTERETRSESQIPGIRNGFRYFLATSRAGFLSSLPEILDLVQGGKLRYLVWYSKQTSYGIFFLYKLLSINIYQHRMCSAMCSCSCSWVHCRKAHAIHTAHIHMHRASNACMPTLPNVHWAPPCDIHPHSMHHRLPHCICSIRGSRPPSRIPTHPAI